MAKWSVCPEGDAPKAVVALAEQVERDGGQTLALYCEPVGNHWQIFCLLPLSKVEPTPYQRDLSPTHAKRLQEVVKKIDRFVDPIVVMSPRPGVYWTPNGNHRRTVLQKLKATITPTACRHLEHAGFLAFGVGDWPDVETLQQGPPRDVLGEVLDRDAGLGAADVGLSQHELIEGNIARW